MTDTISPSEAPPSWYARTVDQVAEQLGVDRDVVGGRRQLMLFGLSFLMIVLASELGVFQRIIDTVPLTGGQWLVCLAAAVGLMAVDEGIKWALRSRQAAR